MIDRRTLVKDSNNKEDPNKNVCSLAVARALSVEDSVRYLHVMGDLVRAVRTRYTVRSRLSCVGKRKTVGSIRTKLAKNTMKEPAQVTGYIVRVDGHVMFLNAFGQTVVDTDPRKKDKRTITHCYIVYR